MIAPQAVASGYSIGQPTDSDWLAFAASRPEATVFHQPAWIGLLARVYGFEPGVFVLRSGNGQIVAGLPFVTARSRFGGKRRVALPFTDHSPALCLPGWESRLAEAVRNLATAKDPIEIHARMESEDRYVISAGVRHVMHLYDSSVMERYLAPTPVGRAIRKATRSGLTVQLQRDLDSVRAFYRLHCLTRRRQGVPVQPWRFFALLHEGLIAKGLGMVAVANVGDRPVAGAVFLYSNTVLVYK